MPPAVSYPPTILVIHPKENRAKCSLEPLRGREDFVNYIESGSARASINFRVKPLEGGRSRLSTETRVRCFGGGQRKFKLYWALIGSFSAWIRRDWLRLIKQSSESASQRIST